MSIINTRVKTCKHRCHLLQDYVGLKRIKFGAEMGYKKCTVCECHFLRTKNIYCQCCSNKLRITVRRRTITTKQKAIEFKNSINNPLDTVKPMTQEEEHYTPSMVALYQRKYRINTEMINKCNSIPCREQRKVSTVPLPLIYEMYFKCVTCKTNWEKTNTHCPCCGLRLRYSARKKTPYNKKDYD